MSVLIFFLVLFALVLVHEWGHFIAAKKTGMRVDEFGIGFPPKLFGVKKGETEYSFNALPIGGFVRIYGENADDAARDVVIGSDISRSFTSKSKWAQSVVLVAGVTMNVLFAWLLFTVALSIGVPTAVEEGIASADALLTVQSVVADGPAAAAGVTAGSVITGVSVDGETADVLTPSAFRAFTEVRAGDTMQLTFRTPHGDVYTKAVVPETGLATDDVNRAVVGVSLALVETTRESIPGAMLGAVEQTAYMLKGITVGITTLIVQSFTGTADFSTVTGPVGIVGMVGDAAAFGFTSLLLFTAMISLNLAVINLLPFPALDGGRLLFVAIEAVTRRPIAPIWVARINTLGFLLLMALMVAVTYKDIIRL
jgi:regulator of sigma E protease